MAQYSAVNSNSAAHVTAFWRERKLISLANFFIIIIIIILQTSLNY
jgi:hypothetical protein